MKVARVPPWSPQPATMAMDWMSVAGAAQQAEIIRARWASVGVQAKVSVQTIEISRRKGGRRHLEHVARLEMPGGVPW